MSDNATEDIWSGDLLNRRSEADYLIKFLTARIDERAKQGQPKSYVLNLNSRWGRGKTFFLTRLQKQLMAGGYLAAYVNAWSDDHADTPLISVMAAIDDVLAPKVLTNPTVKKLWNGAKDNAMQIAATAGRGLAIQVAKRFLGDAAHEIVELVKEVDPDTATGDKVQDTKVEVFADAIDKASEKAISNALDDFRARSKTIVSFRKRTARALAKFGDQQKLPLFVLIDELDRCRPSYAIEMLEQIKHLFEIDGVVFVIATDTDQLGHAVSAVYGAGFDSPRYLLRFFDRTYSFREPNLEPLVKYLFQQYTIDESKLSSPPNQDHIQFFIGAMRHFRLQPRDAHQCFDLLRNVVTVWSFRSRINLGMLVPLIVAHHSGNRIEFERLASLRPRSQDEELEAKRLPEWILVFDGHRGQSDSLNFVDFQERLRRYASMTLNQISTEADTQSASARWARSSIQEEIDRDYTGGYPPHGQSKMLIYPEMVSSASQLGLTHG